MSVSYWKFQLDAEHHANIRWIFATNFHGNGFNAGEKRHYGWQTIGSQWKFTPISNDFAAFPKSNHNFLFIGRTQAKYVRSKQWLLLKPSFAMSFPISSKVDDTKHRINRQKRRTIYNKVERGSFDCHAINMMLICYENVTKCIRCTIPENHEHKCFHIRCKPKNGEKVVMETDALNVNIFVIIMLYLHIFYERFKV